MSNLLELTGLFLRLASQNQTGNAGTSNADQSDDVLVAAVNQSLNLNEQSRVTVLDTALSLMCFTAPQVFDSVIDYSVNTLVSVLSSSINCKVSRLGKAEVLRIGSSISAHDCVRVMESCADVLEKLTEHGTLYRSLLYTIVRVAVMTTRFQYSMQLTPSLNLQSTDERSHALSKLVHYIPKKISIDNQELQLRLLIWYLDPQTLVENISQLLQDVIGRPFICLNEELYEKIEWRSVIICLALSPLMFIETRALLHSWFLHSGLDSVLEFQTGLVSMLLDLLSRPMWWGLSTEVGSNLPFSHAYFLFNHQLIKTMTQPLSCGGFLELVHKIKDSVSHISMVDHKSTWAIAMNFPDWFYFAALLLSGKSFDKFEMLLNYVATGTIIRSTESQPGFKEAVKGACVVFYFTDIAERISGSIFETREIAVDFICQIKSKVVKYLIKCVDKLTKFEIDQKNGFLFKDLHRRMLRWRHQGKEFFHGYLDDTINTIASKLHCSSL
ncbi:hypothetical protein L1887_03391 [Cichorium endivia]|nr:hypothetical protein L1887_03391 [Cichorium endivia]